jgi:hypothetical protein
MSKSQHQASPSAADYSVASYYQERASKLILTKPAPFFDGWCRLPSELNIDIYKHVLPTGLELRSADFKQEKNYKAMVFEEQVLPLLIALLQEPGLIYDTFHSANSMFADTFWTYAQSTMIEQSLAITNLVPILQNYHTSNISQSPPSISHFVRHLKFQIELTTPRLDFLRKLGSGSFGFEDFVNIELFIDGRFTKIGHDCELGVHSDGTDPVGKMKSINAMLDDIQELAPIVLYAKKFLVNYTHVGIFAVFLEQASSKRVERVEDVWEMPEIEILDIVLDEAANPHTTPFFGRCRTKIVSA